MSSFFKEFLRALRSGHGLFAFLAISTLLTISGPFGTYEDLNFLQRARYWFSVVGLAILLVYLIREAVERCWPLRPFWLRGALISTLFTLVFTPLVYGLAHLMTGAQRGDRISPIWLITLVTFSVATAVVQSRLLWETENGERRPRLLARITDPEASCIHHVTVRDHYIEVATDRGTETLLLRFSDAMQELDGIDGMQVHRSHWVAQEAIDTLSRSGGRLALRLKNGSEVPVSRAYQEAVESRFS